MAIRRDSPVAFAIVAVSAVLLIAAAQSVSAIKCYQCNSKSDAYCDDPKANITATESYLRECDGPDLPNNATWFCRKMIQTLMSGIDGGEEGERRVIRKCGYLKSPKPCYQFDNEVHADVVCQCFHDACNSAPRPEWRAGVAAAAACASLLLLLAR